MSDKSIEARVKDIIVDQLGVNADQVTTEAKFVEDLGADSLDTVEIMMALEVRRIYIYFSLGEKERESKILSRKKRTENRGEKLTISFSPSSLSSQLHPQEKFEVTLDEEGAEGIATVSDAADLILAKLG